ncbi:hypothetical protein KUCAC02_007488 [Chaenocephalus aceratus]|uniref:Uncharacterized protein n=1 Tax=Chaenocephalus aceratus TaxID=36190 RepID=A0ACB9X5V1_CHAAC|nr:hypothetical protein KUCAC02_007488 [Chaenocephalus aceratus]
MSTSKEPPRPCLASLQRDRRKAQVQQKTQKTLDVKSHLKGASKALSGMTGKSSLFSMPSKTAEKAKPKRNLKSTSRLFLRLSKKKKPAAGSAPLLGSSKLFAGFGGKSADKKPGLSGFSMFNKKADTKETPPAKKTINLSGLGGKGKMATEAKGLGGKLKGVFGKKKAESGFKTKSSILGKIAAASNWLTGRYLTAKGQGRLDGRAGRQKSLSFANRDTRGRETCHYNEAYEYDDDEYGYEEDYYDRERPRGNLRQPMTYDPYDPYGEDYYDDDEWEDEYGYYDDEGNFYYDDEMYYEEDVDYPYGYYDDEYEEYYADEGIEYYYGEDGLLYAVEPELYSYYGNATDGFYDPNETELYGDYLDQNMGYNYGMTDPYAMMGGGYEVVSGLYNDPMLAYTDPTAIYNPYQPTFYTDAGLDPAVTGQLYGQEQLSYLLPEPVSGEQFRVPRPQVKLFGKERLEVETLPPPPLHYHPSSPMYGPPSPALDLNNLDMMSDIQYELPHTLLLSPITPPS